MPPPDQAPDGPAKPTKTEIRRFELRLALIDQAEKVVAAQGLSALKARDLAADVGCSVGAIYNVVADLTDLGMAVNGRTFQRLGLDVAAALAGRELTPRETLITMSHAYLHFARQNHHSWRALFDLQMSSDGPVPEWYLDELAKLFAMIGRPLRPIFPDWTDQQIDQMTRTLFSAVHGIVLLGLEKRISGVQSQDMEQMISLLLTKVTAQPDASRAAF